MGKLFRHIIRKGKGYKIIKDGISYGTYSDIRDALHDRDLYESAEWDMAEVLAKEEIPNRYLNVDIPSFDDYMKEKEHSKYITFQKHGDGGYYTIQKRINGKIIRFGYYKTFEEAKRKRDKLIEYDWRIWV